MTDRQCRGLFQCRKTKVLPEYQGACELVLGEADLMRTTDMTRIQPPHRIVKSRRDILQPADAKAIVVHDLSVRRANMF